MSLGPSGKAQEMLANGAKVSYCLLNGNLFTNTNPVTILGGSKYCPLQEIVWIVLLYLFQPLLVCFPDL